MTKMTKITAPPYIVLANEGEREQARLRVHQMSCQYLGTPVISAQKTGETTARVVMDLLYVPAEITHRVVNDAFTDHVITMSEQAKGDRKDGWYPGVHTAVEGVPVENAEPLARAFAVIYQSLYDHALGDDAEALPQMPEMPEMPKMPDPAPSVLQTHLAIAAERGYAIADQTNGGAWERYVGQRLPQRHALRCRVEGRPMVLICSEQRGNITYAKLEAAWPEGALADYCGLEAELTTVANAHGVLTDTLRKNVGRRSMIGIHDERVYTAFHGMRLEIAEELARVLARRLPRYLLWPAANG
jgi:hypothetical protein